MLALIGGWQLLSNRVGPYALSQPADVFARLVELATSGELFQMTATTLSVVLLGLCFGGGLGIGLPFLLSLSPRLTRTIEPIVKVLMGVPKLALSPIIILWFGIGIEAKVVLVSLMVFFMLFVSTFAGIRSVDVKLLMMGRILGAPAGRLIREVLWNSALPFVMAALKTAIPWAINAAIVAEFLASDSGLGHYIHSSYDSADMAGAISGVVAVTVLMVLIDFAFAGLQRFLLRWQPVDTRAIY